MRLNKYIAHSGWCSRRAAEELIRSGRVTINGHLVMDLATRVTEGQVVSVDGVAIGLEQDLVYYLVNKPVGYTSTVTDPHAEKTVLDLVDSPYRVYPVGRLDKDSHGLILLTNDGALANALTHPKYDVPKTYVIATDKPLTKEEEERFRSGVILDGKKTAPAALSSAEGEIGVYEVILREGRNRQIRRMIQSFGREVVELTRVAMGPIQLGDLPSGSWREMTDEEYMKLAAEVDIVQNNRQ